MKNNFIKYLLFLIGIISLLFYYILISGDQVINLWMDKIPEIPLLFGIVIPSQLTLFIVLVAVSLIFISFGSFWFI